jgi:phenylethanolamine N-methyltransferase
MDDYSTFRPSEYIDEYYSALDAENTFLLDFYARAYTAERTLGRVVLDVGGGPTIYQLISASRYASRIVFAEFLAVNRKEVKSWWRAAAGHHDWSHFFEHVAKLEGHDSTSLKDLEKRLRGKLSSVVPVDLRDEHPLAEIGVLGVDIVSSAFCIEVISSDIADLERYLSKIIEPLRQGGSLLITVTLNCSRYRVLDRFYPCLRVDADQLAAVLTKKGMSVVIHDTLKVESGREYDGLSAICAIKDS